ncbi:MAG: hypothetical protein KZQ86_21045 [Candidatus Thiodiazotropha sp. (ex Lucinoma kastoroae)]|nr:hypothetical protein [Candidatus Thiodiazotropha sp. (ex Lucinoma kastoroae)]
MDSSDKKNSTESSHSQNGPFFLSLKWKVVLLFSLVLFIINTGLAGMGYLQQRGLFDTYQGQIREQQNRQVTSLLDTSFYRLEQIALMIPALSEADITQQNHTLSKKLESFFST